MWLDQFFIVFSIGILIFDLYGAKFYFDDESKFVNDMRDIVKGVVAKRKKRALKLSDLEEKTETDSDQTEEENDTVSSESDAKIFGIN